MASNAVVLLSLMATTPNANAQSAAPQRGGTLVMAMATEPPTLNPSITTGAPDQLIGCMIYEGLTRIGQDFRIYPMLAKSWDIGSDGLRYTFHLQSAAWQDGAPFTSKDVVFSLTNVSAKYGPVFRAAGQSIATVETPDTATVVLTLNRPFGPLLMSLSCDLNGGILPEHVFSGTDILRGESTLWRPVGTGPFKLAEWVHGDHLTLERNANYWQPGKPYLDKIAARFMPNPPSRVLALQAGEVDYLNEYDFPQSSYSVVKATPALQVGESGFFADYLIILNTKRPPLDNAKVRQALMMALDRHYLAKSVFAGLGSPAQAPVDTRITWATNPDVNYDKMYPYDPGRSNALLDEVGVKRDSAGTRFTIDLVFDSTRQEYAERHIAHKAASGSRSKQ